jgi:tetratricopeptide (TPR) repeat protein
MLAQAPRLDFRPAKGHAHQEMSSKRLRTSSLAGAIRASGWFRHYQHLTVSSCGCFLLAIFVLWLAPGMARAAEAVPEAVARAEETNSMETLRAYVHLQEQIHSTQLAIEQLRRDADQASAENAKVLGSRLEALETALAAQRSRELDAMQSSNRVMLIVAGSFAGVGILAMLLMAYFQWRAVSRLAEMSAALPALRALGPAPMFAALGSGETHLVQTGAAEQSNLRLLGALERLEKRIFELEHTTRTPLHEGTPPAESAGPAHGNGESTAPAGTGSAGSGEAAASSGNAQINLLLSKGQSFLDAENPERALACFDEILKSSPNHAEALVKKGTALERLRKFDEAIECYDRAIAADGSLTIAYLSKGGLFNRLERFSEALDCYEQALHSQEKRA